MEKIKSKDGTPIAYLRQGSGPPLVLVDGIGMIAKNWRLILPALAKNFTVYAVDRRGRGESGDTEPYAIEREYEDIAALVDSIDQPVNLLGHSFGGICTLEGALLTRNVRKLILYEPPINLPGKQMIPNGLIEAVEKLRQDGQYEEALILMYRRIGIEPSVIEMMQTLPEWDEQVAIIHSVPREIRETKRYSFDAMKFENLKVPVKFLVGEDKPPFVYELAEAVSAALPDCSTGMLSGQKHFAMITAPDLFVDVLTQFFKD